ncbi:hypothetical protein FOZ63_033186 [Perkinsus olseni]|uniref:Uncharacterized protein n=1 Tax=Perkinsus olseni TaxID=32597 RepID=A0A7J6RXL1_PEROL|nr:hypothetical protein FOZ63_033186 [Perkinsus olseni]KAF4748390.1 hypothetical protein FOZ62_025519 [Perkinsus olseni]
MAEEAMLLVRRMLFPGRWTNRLITPTTNLSGLTREVLKLCSHKSSAAVDGGVDPNVTNIFSKMPKRDGVLQAAACSRTAAAQHIFYDPTRPPHGRYIIASNSMIRSYGSEELAEAMGVFLKKYDSSRVTLLESYFLRGESLYES